MCDEQSSSAAPVIGILPNQPSPVGPFSLEIRGVPAAAARSPPPHWRRHERAPPQSCSAPPALNGARRPTPSRPSFHSDAGEEARRSATSLNSLKRYETLPLRCSIQGARSKVQPAVQMARYPYRACRGIVFQEKIPKSKGCGQGPGPKIPSQRLGLASGRRVGCQMARRQGCNKGRPPNHLLSHSGCFYVRAGRPGSTMALHPNARAGHQILDTKSLRHSSPLVCTSRTSHGKCTRHVRYVADG